jgi:hypothetical protein
MGFKVLFTLYAKELLKYNGVSSVRPEQGIRNVTKERNQSNSKIEHDVEHHFRPDLIREATFDLLAGPQNHHRHECVDNITDTGGVTVSTK